MRLFLDANILFSAAKTDGAIRGLLGRLREAGHECWVDEFVVFEARRNLAAKGPEALVELDRLVATCRHRPAQASKASVRREDVAWLAEKDRPVLAAAINLRCDALLTGDRTHLGSKFGKAVAGVAIHSPRTLACALLVRGLETHAP
jgi:predicted nucleic acid-binding protein